MNKIKAVLFDLDDTLIIEWKSAEESFIETISLINKEFGNQQFVSIIREEARKLWYKLPTIDYCLKIGFSSYEALWADFTGENKNLKILYNIAEDYRINTWFNTLIKFGIKDIVIAERLSKEFKRLRDKKHILFSDTKEILNQLKQSLKLGLITNGTPDIQWRKIKGGKLEKYFNCIFIAGDFGYGKPEKKLFQKAIKCLNEDTENIIMVGDRLNTDIKGAGLAGLKSVWLNRNNLQKNNSEIKPDYEISDLSQLLEILKL